MYSTLSEQNLMRASRERSVACEQKTEDQRESQLTVNSYKDGFHIDGLNLPQGLKAFMLRAILKDAGWFEAA